MPALKMEAIICYQCISVFLARDIAPGTLIAFLLRFGAIGTLQCDKPPSKMFIFTEANLQHYHKKLLICVAIIIKYRNLKLPDHVDDISGYKSVRWILLYHEELLRVDEKHSELKCFFSHIPIILFFTHLQQPSMLMQFIN